MSWGCNGGTGYFIGPLTLPAWAYQPQNTYGDAVMTDPKDEIVVSDAPDDAQPEPTDTPIEEPPPPEDDAASSPQPPTEGD